MKFDRPGPLTRVRPPLVIDDVDAATWHRSVDIVVVGFGGAGACAALQARELGASVLAIDRFDGGGATKLSGGVVYAGGTRIQHEAGVDDSVEEMHKYLSMEFGEAASDRTIRRFCEESAASIEWLESHGVPFKARAATAKTGIYPPRNTYLYFSGNETVPSYKEKAKPAPRGHRTFGKGFTGKVLFAALQDAAIRSGVDLMSHAPVRRLVLNRSGRVLGVEAVALSGKALREHQQLFSRTNPMQAFATHMVDAAGRACRELETGAATILLRAQKGVVLATGGFAMNQELVKRHAPAYGEHYRSLIPTGALGCDGSGIELGATAGGALAWMDSFYCSRNLSPPDAMLKGILVNAAGRRFINEEVYPGYIGKAIEKQPGCLAWLILDRKTYLKALWQCRPQGCGRFLYFLVPNFLGLLLGGTRKGATLAGLAAKCGIPVDALSATVERNNAAAQGAVDEFGKSARNLCELRDGPFYAVNLAMANKYSFTSIFSLGGLTVDEDTGNVKREDGSGIPGLYAAGRTAASMISHQNISGTSLAECVFSGRRAARAAVQAAPN